jgi:putative tryptophan/tyrosine transport system substrate-binding protein
MVVSCGAVAQQRRVLRIGILWHAGNAEEEKIPLGALVEGLRDVGYTDGQTMTLDNRFPNEEPARFKLLATELVASRPDVLITVTRQAAIAAKQETTAIPPLCARPRRPVSASFRRIAVSLVLACISHT